jgi:hypothetical protein
MDKIQEIEVSGVKHIIIDRGNEEFTSMPKSVYDAQKVTNDPEGNK